MEPKRLMVIKDPEVAKLLGDELRRNILHLVTLREMSAADIVKELDKNYSSVVYHVKLLEEAGLVKKVREEVIQNKIQAYYRASAYYFHVSYYLEEAMMNDEEYSAWQEDLYNRLLNGLSSYNLMVPDEKRQRAKELLKVLYIEQKKEFEERMEKRCAGVQLDPSIAHSIEHIIANVQLLQDKKHREAAEELAKLLGL